MQKEHLENDNYTQEVIPINMGYIQILSVVILGIFAGLFSLVYYLINDKSLLTTSLEEFLSILYTPLLAIVFLVTTPILLIIAHEGIHAFFGALFSDNGFKSIKLGIMGAKGYYSPYCHCKEALKVWQFSIVIMMPTIVLGFVPVIIGLTLGGGILVVVGVFMISSGAGDIVYVIKMLKFNKDDFMFEFPNEQNILGFMIYKKLTS